MLFFIWSKVLNLSHKKKPINRQEVMNKELLKSMVDRTKKQQPKPNNRKSHQTGRCCNMRERI